MTRKAVRGFLSIERQFLAQDQDRELPRWLIAMLKRLHEMRVLMVAIRRKQVGQENGRLSLINKWRYFGFMPYGCRLTIVSVMLKTEGLIIMRRREGDFLALLPGRQGCPSASNEMLTEGPAEVIRSSRYLLL